MHYPTAPSVPPVAPYYKLPTNRGLFKTLILSLLTFGIYGIYVWFRISGDLNTIAGKYDLKKTTNYLVACILSVLTLSIYGFWWMHTTSARVGHELRRRGIKYSFGAKHFWLVCLLLSVIGIGPFIYFHRLLRAMNLLSADYNARS